VLVGKVAVSTKRKTRGEIPLESGTVA
jgi:hypothetical protein